MVSANEWLLKPAGTLLPGADREAENGLLSNMPRKNLSYTRHA